MVLLRMEKNGKGYVDRSIKNKNLKEYIKKEENGMEKELSK